MLTNVSKCGDAKMKKQSISRGNVFFFNSFKPLAHRIMRNGNDKINVTAARSQFLLGG